MPNDSRSVRLYRRLIEFYPAAFHQTDAGSLEQAFRDRLDKASGTWGFARLWFFVLADLFISIPVHGEASVNRLDLGLVFSQADLPRPHH